MEIFIDSASILDIEKWIKMGIVDGVTTNPSVMLNDRVYEIEKGAKEIAALIDPRPLSVEVTTNDLEEMLTQAQTFASWARNIIIKVPQENQDGVPCYGVMRRLESDGIRVNATVTLSFGQVILAAKAGATYISIFAGRVEDEGGDAVEMIRNSVDWLNQWEFRSKIIIGSIRSVADILRAAKAGAHVITIPPQFLSRMADHRYTRATVEQFVRDADGALAKMKESSQTRKK